MVPDVSQARTRRARNEGGHIGCRGNPASTAGADSTENRYAVTSSVSKAAYLSRHGRSKSAVEDGPSRVTRCGRAFTGLKWSPRSVADCRTLCWESAFELVNERFWRGRPSNKPSYKGGGLRRTASRHLDSENV